MLRVGPSAPSVTSACRRLTCVSATSTSQPRSLPMWNADVKRSVCPFGKRTISAMVDAIEPPVTVQRTGRRRPLWNDRPHRDRLGRPCGLPRVVGHDQCDEIYAGDRVVVRGLDAGLCLTVAE